MLHPARYLAAFARFVATKGPHEPHSQLLLRLAVPFDGELTCDHLEALSPGAYRCGQIWGIHIEVAGATFYHQGSANLIDDAIRHRGVDYFSAEFEVAALPLREQTGR
jgi:hypothetical protein